MSSIGLPVRRQPYLCSSLRALPSVLITHHHQVFWSEYYGSSRLVSSPISCSRSPRLFALAISQPTFHVCVPPHLVMSCPSTSSMFYKVRRKVLKYNQLKRINLQPTQTENISPRAQKDTNKSHYLGPLPKIPLMLFLPPTILKSPSASARKAFATTLPFTVSSSCTTLPSTACTLLL